MTPVQRFLSPSYSDGLQAPRRSVLGAALPTAREISSLVHENQNVENPGITHLLMQWGQFLDHDVTSSSQTRGFNGSVPRCCKDGGRDFVPKDLLHPECFPIVVPPSDPFYGPRGIRCLDFVRSSPAPRDDCALGWREQLNQVSAYIDGSPLYGSSARQSDKLRLFRNGMLQYGRVQQRRPVLPPERRDELCRGGAVSADCFRSGDARVNEHPGLVAAHIVWLRHHNRMAQELAHLNPHWSDEKIYQETRKIVGAMIQHITYREFLPIVLGSEVIRLFEIEPLKKGYFKGYNPKINPSPASSFGSAAFRFGHSLVQSSMVRFDRFHRPIINNVSLHNELTNPSNIWSMGAVDRLLLGMVNQPIQNRDEFISEELTNHLFQTPQVNFGMDLAAINIQRGRDHGVPSYTSWREPCGLSVLSSFEDLFRVMPARAVKKLKILYRHVDDIDLFTGGMAERPVVGGLVGPTFACIIAQQFSNLRKGDRFWYENGGFESSFTPAQLQQIRRISLAQVLCHTLDTIDNIQPFVFLSSDNPDNDRISCKNGLMNNFDLSPWTEVDSDSNNDISKSEIELTSTTQKPQRNVLTTTVKPTTTTSKQTTTNKSNQNKTTPNLTKTENVSNTNILLTDRRNTTDRVNVTNKTMTDKHNKTMLTNDQNNTAPSIDDKLDFKNKSKRYDDSADMRYRPTRKYTDYDYDDDENVQSVQSVVINNVPKKRPYHRPVISVTENIDKYTYLINYVPRPTESWRQTTRRTHDRDVVKVTYQTYDDTYRRPNKPYYYNRRDDMTDDKNNNPHRYTITNDFHSSARSNGDGRTTTKLRMTDKTTQPDKPTTENIYKLVTFGYVGSYKGEMPSITKDNTNLKRETTDALTNKSEKTAINAYLADKKNDNTNLTLDHPVNISDSKTLDKTDINTATDINTETDDVKLKETDDFITYKNTSPKTVDNAKLDTVNKDFVTYDKTNIDDEFTNMKLSTFFQLETATKSYNGNMIRPTRRNEENIPNHMDANTKYFYVKNVLHKYSETNATHKPVLKENVVDQIQPKKNIIKENYNNPGVPQMNIEERSAGQIAMLEDTERKSSSRLRIKIKKPIGPAKTPSVAFQVIPSENSPSHWVVYEENDNLPESLPHKMPSISLDPHALKEIPRPIRLKNIRRRKPSNRRSEILN